jgi:hypothetical protein
MRKPTLGTFLGTCVLALGPFAAAAHAQNTPQHDASGGASFSRVWQSGHVAQHAPQGWYADAARRVGRSISIVASGSGNYKTLLGHPYRVHTWMVGASASSRSIGRVVPFARLQAGFGQFTAGGVSSTHGGVSLGAGVTMWSTLRIGARLGADYLRVFSKGPKRTDTTDPLNGLRLTAGVAIRLGSSRP